ncbi:pseudouridine synthase [Plastorhodobacter daqingensis]|uniref:Pseudouridine synthase n=1 Tax=Plastorhodobacter daqingensis TaxID=1387281 RepID=A0ABW2UGR3_9RHOB
MAGTTGERIAKVLARAGLASRREAEKLVEAGRVSVNGKKIDSPALNVGPKDTILVDGKPLAAPEPARVWLYYKPLGLVTSARDEKGRDTVFDNLPEDLPRVMSIGRLDLNSEGLLLLTNDGALKRKLELPETGWLRKYRVRVNGTPTDEMLEPLRKGITVEGERFQGMVVTIDRQQGANAWLTVGLREGRNREIRRAMEAVGLKVNRLIRISYGPFKLGEMQPGAVEEVRPKILRDQLGLAAGREAAQPPLRPKARPSAQKRGTRSAAEGAPSETPRTKPGRPGPKPGADRAETGAKPAARSKATAGDRAEAHAPEKGFAKGTAKSFGKRSGKTVPSGRPQRETPAGKAPKPRGKGTTRPS